MNGKMATVGSLPLFDAEHQVPAELRQETLAAESQGQTTMLVCDGERVRGFLGAQDSVRPEAQAVVAALKQRGMHTVMLTGDNAETAEQVAGLVGLDESHAGLLPEEKYKLLGELKQKYGQVLMVGTAATTARRLPARISASGWGGLATPRCSRPRTWS